ncbi:Defensin-like protein 140 [Arabidopsis thaliana]
MSKSSQLIVTVLCIFTILVLGEICMAKGQPLEEMVECKEVLWPEECKYDACAFACVLKRHGKGGCLEGPDYRSACICQYACKRS